MPDGTGFKGVVGRLLESTEVVAHVHHGVEMRLVSGNLLGESLHHLSTLFHKALLQCAGGSPYGVEFEDAELIQVLDAVHDLRYVFVIVEFLLLVGDVDGDNVGVLGVVHFNDLLLVGILRLGLVVARLRLFALGFELLAGCVILVLDFAEMVIRGITLGSESIGIVGVALAHLFESASKVFERIGDLLDEFGGVGIVLGGSGFESCQLCRPGSDGCAGKGRN